jgi:hypothetical protein
MIEARTKTHVPVFHVLWMLVTGRWGNTQYPKGFQDLPEKIGDFALVTKINRPEGHNECQFGIYKNQDGVEAIAKQWSGNYPNENYYWLVNERNVYRYLEDVNKKYQALLSEKFPDVVVPKLFQVAENQNRMVLLIEKLNGSTLTDPSFAERIDIFERGMQYLEFIDKLESNYKSTLLGRTPGFFLFQVPILYLMALSRNPSWFFPLTKGLMYTLTFYLSFWKNFNPRVVHRDMTVNNVLKTVDGKVGLIDFQLSVYTDGMIELAQIMSGSFNMPEFRAEYYQHPRIKAIFADPAQYKSFLFASLYTALHLSATCKSSIQPRNLVYLKENIELASKI